ncbi:long-chain fatty acid--CoA ligase, partial [Burkholderia sp. SIMBA_019]
MEKVWLKSYPPGVPAEIDASQYASITALLTESFNANRAKPAFACMGKAITYGQLDELSKRLAAWFQSRG